MITFEIRGFTEALRNVNRWMGVPVKDVAQRAMHRCGALVQRTAVQFAPISPSRGMLQKLFKAGGKAGTTITTKATNRFASRQVTLTKWYADRLNRLLREIDMNFDQP